MSSEVLQRFDRTIRNPRRITLMIAGLTILAFSAQEVRTAFLQSRLFPLLAARLTWQVEPGESPSIRFPGDGPFDVTRGYSRIPDFRSRLQARDFRVVEQSRFSPSL